MKTQVLFDGDCSFCSALALHAERFDRRDRLELTPLQSPGVLAQHGVPLAAAAEALHVVSADGSVHVGGRAIQAVLAELAWLWPASYLWLIPGFPYLMEHLYHWIARNRHTLGRWLGLEASCQSSDV